MKNYNIAAKKRGTTSSSCGRSSGGRGPELRHRGGQAGRGARPGHSAGPDHPGGAGVGERRPPPGGPALPADGEQVSLMDLGSQTVLKKLRMTDVNILSPIEAPQPAGGAEAGPAGELRRGGEARMKEEVSGMGRPNSRAELCAWVLGLMGAFFLLFGGPSCCGTSRWGGGARLGLPAHRGRPAGGGGGCPWPAWPGGGARRGCGREGTAVSGTVRSVRHHIFVTWNTQSFVNVPGRNSPWSAVVRVHLGRLGLYRVHRPAVGGAPGGAEVLVWLDPDRPGRAFVDPDSVRLDLMG